MDDLAFMSQALALAKKAYNLGEVPVGALIVLDGVVIASAHNRVEELQDPTAHAEILAIREASRKIGNWRLLDATLYCTLEPCAMCASAALLARLKRIVYGAPDIRFGAAGSFINIFEEVHPTHRISPEKGPLAEESAQLMRAFFQEKRIEKGIKDAT